MVPGEIIVEKRLFDVIGKSFSGYVICPGCGELMTNSRWKALSRLDTIIFAIPHDQFECDCGVIGLAKVVVEEIKK